SWIMYCVHRVEKGLSHDDFRAGFGETALTDLSNALRTWKERDYSPDAEIITISENVLRGYVHKHEREGADLPAFFQRLFPLFDAGVPEDGALEGVREFDSHNADAATCGIEELLRNRRSVREYSSEPVDRSKLDKAIELAILSPSVCNRQSWRVTIIEDPEVIEGVLDRQGGWRGYAYPPVLLLLSSDLRTFLFIQERNEAYVDGGIFLMSLLLGLESEGLAACTLNTMFHAKADREIRGLVDMPAHEVPIALVAVGNFPEHSTVPASTRYSPSHFVRVIG
ncbi:MAG: nitroreductase family protein, partial [Atopobiaceae bacterium]|nr:nitroreductase family protein [Atopobiaceae bacterium]